MRSLAIILYCIIMGCLVFATYIAEYSQTDSYAKEVSAGYTDFAELLSPLIMDDMLSEPDDVDKVLATWESKLHKEIVAIKLINKPAKTAQNNNHYVSTVDVTESTDYVTVVSLLSTSPFDRKALEYLFYDSYSDEFMRGYYISYLTVYIFMGLVISVVALVIYQYMQKISSVTRAVASGRFDNEMPSSRIGSLQILSDDINTMARTIGEKTTENIILTGAIHHELRIPVTRIRLALDIALQESIPATTQNLLQDMDTDLEELTQLMEEILTISRLRLTSSEIPKAPACVQDVIKAVIASVNSPLVSLEGESDFQLEANSTLLERALFNIVNNAVKYADTAIRISWEPTEHCIALCIADDGPGIPEQDRALVFTPFYRVDKGRSRSTGGFGLGLAIASMVIKDTQGRIEISDSDMGGALFRLSWPRS